MSDKDESINILAELTKKINICNKNVRTVIETLNTIEEKLNEKKVENKENEKERMNKIFEKKQIGRPVGTWDEKRKMYLEYLIQGKIKNPKEETLTYYKITKDDKEGIYY